MNFDLYFVALVKNNEVSYLEAGPFVNCSDAKQALVKLEPASCSGSYKVIKLK